MHADARMRVEHGWCLNLKTSQAFRFFLSELEQRQRVAMREVCAEAPSGSREFQAGRLSALAEAATLIDKKYAELAKHVEKVEE